MPLSGHSNDLVHSRRRLALASERPVPRRPAADSLLRSCLRRQPLPKHKPAVGTAAYMVKAGQAAEALVWFLGGDPRVRRAYAEWCRSHGLVRGEIVVAVDAYMRSALENKERDLAKLDSLVRNELGLEYPWLAPLLLFAFGSTAIGNTGRLSLTPADLGLPAGRRAKGKGQYIARDVEWFYRAEIKVPPDTVRSIAKEHSAQAQSAGLWHSVVQNGIARAKDLLAVMDIETAI